MTPNVLAPSPELKVIKPYAVGLFASVMNVNAVGNRAVGVDVNLPMDEDGSVIRLTTGVALLRDLPLVDVARRDVAAVNLYRRRNGAVVVSAQESVWLTRNPPAFGDLGKFDALSAPAGAKRQFSDPRSTLPSSRAVAANVIARLSLNVSALLVRLRGNRGLLSAAAQAKTGGVGHVTSFRGCSSQITAKAVTTQ